MDLKGTQIHEFFNLFWFHIRNHIETDLKKGSQEEVESFKCDTEVLIDRYKDVPALHKFAKTCLIAYMTYLEETNEN